MDTLSVKINLQSTEADRLMRQLNTQFDTADKNVKTLTSSMGKFGATENDVRGVGTQVDRVSGKMKTLTSIASATGRGLKSAFNSTVISMNNVLRVAGLISAALGGLGAAKASRDYMEYSRRVGIVNATMRGTVEEARTLETEGLQLSAVTGGDAVEIQRGFNQLISTTEFGFDQYKDAAGKIIDQTGYDLQKKTNNMILENVGKLGSAVNVTPYEQIMTTLGMAGALNMSLSAKEGLTGIAAQEDSLENVNKLLTMQVAIIHNAKGEWADLGPQIQRSAPSLMGGGFSNTQAAGIYSELTKYADPQKAGMMAEALGRNIMRIPETLKKVRNAIDEGEIEASYEDFRSIFFDDKGMMKQGTEAKYDMIGDMLTWINDVKTDEERLQRATVILGEIREKRALLLLGRPEAVAGMKLATSNIETMMLDPENWKKEWEYSLTTVGMRWTYLKAQITAASMATAGGLFNIVEGMLGGKSVDISEYSSAIDNIGTAMDEIVPGSSIIAEKMKQFMEYVSSDKGKAKLREIGTLISNLAKDLGKLVDMLMRLVESPSFDALFKRFTEKPIETYLEFKAAQGILPELLKLGTEFFIIEKGVKIGLGAAGLGGGALGASLLGGAGGAGAAVSSSTSAYAAGFTGLESAGSATTAAYASGFTGLGTAAEATTVGAAGGGLFAALGSTAAISAAVVGSYLAGNYLAKSTEAFGERIAKDELSKISKMTSEEYLGYMSNRTRNDILKTYQDRAAQWNKGGIAGKVVGSVSSVSNAIAAGLNKAANSRFWTGAAGIIPGGGYALNKMFKGNGVMPFGARDAQDIAKDLREEFNFFQLNGGKVSPSMLEALDKADALQLSKEGLLNIYERYGKGYTSTYGGNGALTMDQFLKSKETSEDFSMGANTLLNPEYSVFDDMVMSTMEELGSIPSILDDYFGGRTTLDATIVEAVNAKLTTPVPFYATVNVPSGGGQVTSTAVPGVSATRGAKFNN